jgi:imidazole glycerol-phosphate synthase subunit HisF
MFRPRIIPCLLLKEGGLVKTTKFQNPVYVGDPINAVKIFNDFEVDELVFLDIDASKQNRTVDLNLIKKIGDEAFMPFSVGGGIKTINEIKTILNAGVEKVILNSNAINNLNFIKEASDIFGSQSIVVCIDFKKSNSSYEVFTHGGTIPTGLTPLDVAKNIEKAGAGEIILNSIDRDGTREGYDIYLIKQISESVQIPVIALGGAKDSGDFIKAIKEGKASAVAAGSTFVFIGKKNAVLINYPDKKEMKDCFKFINKS